MPLDDSFQVLLGRVRAGDEEAAAQIVRRYEPALRRLIRMRLTDPHLTRLLDSVDVCQSVLANFFVRMAAGQFDLNTPEQLLKLLSVMARNRLLDHVARETAGRRDQRRTEGEDALAGVAAPQPSPSQVVAARTCWNGSGRRCPTRSASWPTSERSAASGPRSPWRPATAPRRCGSGWRGPWTERRGRWAWTR